METGCVPKIATGFGAGMGRHGETCGALVGAIMALGLKYGREEAADLEAKTITYDKAQALLQTFKQEFGTVVCCDLIGCDFQTEEGNERFKQENLIVECRKFVGFAAREVLRLIEG